MYLLLLLCGLMLMLATEPAKAHQPRSEHHRIRRSWTCVWSGEIYLNPVTLPGCRDTVCFHSCYYYDFLPLRLLRRINTGERQEHCGRRISCPTERALSNGTLAKLPRAIRRALIWVGRCTRLREVITCRGHSRGSFYEAIKRDRTNPIGAFITELPLRQLQQLKR